MGLLEFAIYSLAAQPEPAVTIAGLGIGGKEVTTAHWSELYDRRCVAVCVLVHNWTS